MSEPEQKPDSGAQENSPASSASGSIASNSPGTPPKRLTAMAAAAEAMKLIDLASKDKSIKIRVDDSKSAILMALSIIFLVISCWMVGDNPAIRNVGVALVLLADALCGLSIILYCIQRFGFIRCIDPRYAIVCWHLVLGTGVLFTFISTNVMLTLAALSRMK